MNDEIELRQQPRSTSNGLAFNAEQRKMIREMYAPGSNESEFGALIAIAEARGLNPLLKQVYFVKRWDSQKKAEVWAVQGSIDGLRAIAQRTGLYDGQDEPEFEHDASGKPTLARVRVYRKDWSRAAVGVARWTEYAQMKKDGGLTSFWATKGHIMLSKCAEALALRKAFPEDMGGIYVPEEMDEQQRANATREVTPSSRPPPTRGVITDDPPPPALPEPAHDETTGEVQMSVTSTITPAAEAATLAGLLAEITEHPDFNAKPHSDNWWKQRWGQIKTLTPPEQKVIRRALDSKIKPNSKAAQKPQEAA